MRDESGSEPDWWGAAMLARPPREAIWAQGGYDVTYERLRTQVSMLRRLFQAHGIRPGGTVALQGAESFTQIWSVFALWSLGAQVMLMGAGIRGGELGLLLDRCRPQFYISFDTSGSPARTFHDECEVYVRRIKGGRRAATDHCLVQFTSGSTGYAKAVGRTPQSLQDELVAFSRLAGMPGPGERVLLLGPLTHSFNLIGGLLHHMSVGAVSVFAPRASRSAALRTAIRSNAAAVLAAPAHFAALTLTDHSVRLPRLRCAISGGDRLPERVYARFADQYGVRIGQAYGTTETGIVAADPVGWFSPGAVGMVAPGIRIRILDGELQVRLARTPYLGEEGPPTRFVPDGADGPGWLSTRDRAELDPLTGAVRILGRFDPPADRRTLTHGVNQRLLSDRTAMRPVSRSGAPAP
ncbi:class I adenylate-forming enzyme family protein [Streptomyces sp. NPDC006632]|uniref:class I adenylate-forming enzyme family protein n=1 Tax=unclassified Streptomyces TaxID=2593676 RepID=UPI002E234C82